MKHFLAAWLVLLNVMYGNAQSVFIPNVWINEIHYDDVGNDTLEGYEVAGPAGTNLACYKVYLYNGANGDVYDTDTLSGILTDAGCGFGTLWFQKNTNGIQNGPSDGIVLEYAPQATGCGVNHVDTIIQLLSYEGNLTALSGRAQGLVLPDINVSENGNSPDGFSLQLGGVGTSYAQFTWQASQANTYSAVNINQYFCGAPQTSYRFTVNSLTVNEGDGTVVGGYIKATNVLTAGNSVDVVLKTGTAADVNNYTTQTFSFAAFGIDSQAFNLTLTDDALAEGTEVLQFVLRNATNGAQILADSLLNLTITDNDVAINPLVQFGLVSSTVAENGVFITVAVNIQNPNTNPTSVDVMVSGGTATQGNDYTFTPSTITFPANSNTPQNITVNIVNDALAEGNETVTFMLMNPTNSATIGTQANHTLTIQDNDGQQISVYPPTQTQFENIGTINIPVLLNNPSSNATSVQVALVAAGTTATQGLDYTFNDTTITWPANTSGTIQVPLPVIDDNLYEFSETVALVLRNATNGAIITADSTFLLTILNNDALPVTNCSNLFFSEYVEGSSNNKALEIYNPTNAAINMADYRIFKSINGGTSTSVFQLTGIIAAGDVYVLANTQSDPLLKLKADTLTGFLNFNGDDALALLHLNDTIDVIGQIGVDPGNSWPVDTGTTENYTLIRNYYTYIGSNNWNNAAETWDVHPVNTFDSLGFHHIAPCGTVEPIIPAVVTFEKIQDTVAEGNLQVKVVVKTDNPTSSTVTFAVARDNAGSTATPGQNSNDFEYTNQTLNVSPGVSFDTVTIKVFDDNLIEPTENVLLRFINLGPNVVTGSDSLYNLYITDSDQLEAEFLGGGFGYLESAGTVQVKVTLSTSHVDTVTVQVKLAAGSATKGSDYLFNDTTLVFLPNTTGSDTQGVWVTILEDQLDEGNEQINFDLVNITGSAVPGQFLAYTLTIIDNDSVVGINAIEEETSLRIFPNPATDAATIKAKVEFTAIEVVALTGAVVAREEFAPTAERLLPLNTLTPGWYTIIVLTPEARVYRRLVINR